MVGLPLHSVRLVEALRVDDFPRGRREDVVVQMVGDGMGRPIVVPVAVVRGAEAGPVVGVTAVVHGNELNGIDAIFELLAGLEPDHLRGTVVAVPVVNVPGYLQQQRYFNDHRDLNRVMPGKPRGTNSEVYAHRLMERIISQFDYMLDLHTASTGRINSLYVRADLTHVDTAWMACGQRPQIILHNKGVDGTLRGAAMDRGIAAITVEIGNPLVFQRNMVQHGVSGVRSVLARLGMVEWSDDDDNHEPVVCAKSYWLYTGSGGVLKVFPHLLDQLEADQRVAEVRNIFGHVEETYTAPEAGIVIGRATNPVNQTGSRILHLGIRAKPGDFPFVDVAGGAVRPGVPGG